MARRRGLADILLAQDSQQTIDGKAPPADDPVLNPNLPWPPGFEPGAYDTSLDKAPGPIGRPTFPRNFDFGNVAGTPDANGLMLFNLGEQLDSLGEALSAAADEAGIPSTVSLYELSKRPEIWRRAQDLEVELEHKRQQTRAAWDDMQGWLTKRLESEERAARGELSDRFKPMRDEAPTYQFMGESGMGDMANPAPRPYGAPVATATVGPQLPPGAGIGGAQQGPRVPPQPQPKPGLWGRLQGMLLSDASQQTESPPPGLYDLIEQGRRPGEFHPDQNTDANRYEEVPADALYYGYNRLAYPEGGRVFLPDPPDATRSDERRAALTQGAQRGAADQTQGTVAPPQFLEEVRDRELPLADPYEVSDDEFTPMQQLRLTGMPAPLADVYRKWLRSGVRAQRRDAAKINPADFGVEASRFRSADDLMRKRLQGAIAKMRGFYWPEGDAPAQLKASALGDLAPYAAAAALGATAPVMGPWAVAGAAGAAGLASAEGKADQALAKWREASRKNSLVDAAMTNRDLAEAIMRMDAPGQPMDFDASPARDVLEDSWRRGDEAARARASELEKANRLREMKERKRNADDAAEEAKKPRSADELKKKARELNR